MALATSSTAWAFGKMHRKREDGEPELRPFVMETKFDGGWKRVVVIKGSVVGRPWQRFVTG